jgi:hypothetical protein
MKVTEKLKVLCGFTPHQIVPFINNPEWESTKKTHDWRNHISAVIRDIWDTLSEEARLVAYFTAKCQADNEEWE